MAEQMQDKPMTVIEALIKDVGDMENVVSRSIELHSLSKRAGQVLIDEVIKMIVGMKAQQIVMTQQQVAMQRARDAIVVPQPPPLVKPS